MTSWPALDSREITACLANILEQPVRHIRILNRQGRPYSCVWTLEVTTDKKSIPILAKAVRDTTVFQNQMRALEQAHAPFAGRTDICIPYLGACARLLMIFMPFVPDPAVSKLLKYPPTTIRRLNPRTWKRDLATACECMGRWLREWHTTHENTGSLRSPLEHYLGKRQHDLAVLKLREKERLQELIASLRTGPTCVPHGDFAPQNVLWSPQRMTILDFGIAEWKQMSPCWDQVTMEIGLMRELKFSYKSPGAWSASATDAAINAFRSGYGPFDRSSPAYLACLAIRHLVLHAHDQRQGRRYQRRAAWHQKELSRILMVNAD